MEFKLAQGSPAEVVVELVKKLDVAPVPEVVRALVELDVTVPPNNPLVVVDD